jgi:pyridoxamine 5'-phosphate oxidase
MARDALQAGTRVALLLAITLRGENTDMATQTWEQEIDKYLDAVRFGLLAYVRGDGTPVQRRLGSFAKDGNRIFFSTRGDAAKVQEIHKQPRVSFLLEAEGQELPKWKSALILGKASVLPEGPDLKRAVEVISARNPRFKERVGKEGLANTRIFAIQATEIDITDYSKGFGHSEKINVRSDEVV